MAYASYERQLLATYAAGTINAPGTTITTFGCSLSRSSAGVYVMSFDASSGLVNDESYTLVTVKGTATSVPVMVTVEDTSNVAKTIYTRSASSSAVDCDLEVIELRSTTKFMG